MICIDGIFLTGRYKGQILTAIGVDCNNQIVPLAFAFVENENIDSWYWFLERVKIHVVAARPDVCLISDRHAVAKMASHAIFQYNVLAIDDTHNTWTNMIVKINIPRLLGSSDDKEKIGAARPEGQESKRL